MDAAISVAIVLFILSMINERIANFIKLQFSGKSLFGMFMGNLRTKSDDTDLEDDRSKRILVINIVCGTVVSIMMRADLISILGHADQPYEVIGWDKPLPVNFIGWLLLFLGCFLTGCFLSLGSKFWHDLLDLLLYTKNLKGKLVDERTFRQTDSIDQLQEFINTPEFKLSQIAIDKYAVVLRAIPGVLTVGPGYVFNGVDKIGCVEIHVSDNSSAQHIQKTLPIQISSGGTIAIPTKVVVTGGYPSVNAADAGKGVSNQSGINGKGTIGAVVKDSSGRNHYVLSCYHVLNGDMNWTQPSNSTTILDENGTPIGSFYFGFRTSDMDVAIAKLNDGVSFSNALINNPSVIRSVTFSDVTKETKVSILGAKTGVTSNGFVYNNSWPSTFKYPDGKLWQLNDLIVLTKINPASNTFQTITKGGDSGALVVDDHNIAIGLVVGGDDAFTYAVKLDKIAENLDISL